MLTAHTHVEVEGAVERGPFEDEARGYFETLWQEFANQHVGRPIQEVAGTVEFSYYPLDTPVGEMSIDCVQRPNISVTSTLSFSANESEPETVVIAAAVAYRRTADTEAAIARMADTLPEYVTTTMRVRAHTPEDQEQPMPCADGADPAEAGRAPESDPRHLALLEAEPDEGSQGRSRGDDPLGATAAERLEALLKSHPDMHLFVSVPVLTPAGLAWLDNQTQDMSVSVLTEEWDEEAFRSAPDDQRRRILNFVARGNTSVFVRRQGLRWLRSSQMPTPRVWIVEEMLEDYEGCTFVGKTLAAFSGPTILSGHWLDSEDDSLAPLDQEDVCSVSRARSKAIRRARLADEQIMEAVPCP